MRSMSGPVSSVRSITGADESSPDDELRRRLDLRCRVESLPPGDLERDRDDLE